MSNQASEDELRVKVYNEIKLWLSPHESLQFIDDFMPIITSFIRTEKLKLLAEVREQTTIFKIKAHDKKGQPHLYEAGRGVPIEQLTKLEAEL